MELKTGIHDGVPFKDYLSIPYFSKSMVPELVKSPKHLKWIIDHPEDDPDRKMVLGNAVDALLLEPATFGSRFWTIPPTYINSKKEVSAWTKQSKTCREAEAAAVMQGLTPIRSEDVEKAGIIINKIMDHPLASDWISRGKPQQTIIWFNETIGLKCKGRADIIIPGSGILPERIVDLKLTAYAGREAFSRIINSMLYHVQAAMYHDGAITAMLGEDPQDVRFPFSFIVAEYEPPFDVVCYTLEIPSVVAGRTIFHERAQVYADAARMDWWPGISSEDEMIGIPVWAEKRIMEDGARS